MSRFDSLHSVELSRVLLEASAVLRHDLRNRLGSIRNMAFFVRKRVGTSEVAEKDPRIVEFLDTIEGEVERATALMESWGDRVSSLHRHRLSRTLASKVIELAVASARVDPQVELRVTCEEATLDCDPLEVALALRCLIENAAEASGAGTVDISAALWNRRYHFSVRDRGPGIDEPKELLKRLESDKAGHLGVGLCMTKRLVEEAGGDLFFGPAPGGGSEVGLSIPAPSRSLFPTEEQTSATAGE
jgi:signal transduction histidine kinase